MKLKIITDRGPFVDGRKAAMDDIVDVSDDAGKAMIANGFAQRIDEPKPAAKKRGRPKKDG
jgi:rare lipoprotein A (peptidoglycan hydrolase)